MPKQNESKVKAGLLVPDSDVAVPNGRNYSYSFTGHLASLEVGETAARTVSIDSNYTLEEIRENINDWRENLRNTVMTAVRGAKVKLGKDAAFKVELTDVQTQSTNWYVLALVTRVE